MEQKKFMSNNGNIGGYNIALGFNQKYESNPLRLNHNGALNLLSFDNLGRIDRELNSISPYFLSDFVEAAIEDLRIDSRQVSGLESSLLLRKIDDLQFAQKGVSKNSTKSAIANSDARSWGYFVLLGENNVPYKLIETFPTRISERGLVGDIGDLIDLNQIKGSEICIMGVPDSIMNYNIPNNDIIQVNLTKH